MESLSWTREPPPRTADAWRYGGPKPEGYDWPSGAMSVGLYLVCAECGAAVYPPGAGFHTRWHASL